MDEAEEHIQLLNADIVRLESEGGNQELLQEIFRAAHTLKSSSAMLGHERMAEVTHAMESLLDKLRNREIAINPGIIDALLCGLDALQLLKSEVMSQRESDLDVQSTVYRLNKAAGAPRAELAGRQGAGPHVNGKSRSRLITPGRNTEIKPVGLKENRARDIVPEAKLPDSSGNLEALQSIRVDVIEIDRLINMTEELMIEVSRIGRVGKMLEVKYPDDDLVGDIGDTANDIIKVISGLHKDIMKVRMVPISVVFSQFPRLVRDTARKLHKNLDFIIKGESTEIDRTMLEKIQDPLVHLLRNAVDHGIETPEERKMKGKPGKGLVRLAAYQEEGHIVIEMEDDGRGIDPRQVRHSAVRKGFITAAAAARLSDAEAIDLAFSPGMSTAEKATEVSGRGVGLDIVRTNIERLNGNVTLHTRVNQGTIFTIRLPLGYRKPSRPRTRGLPGPGER